MNTRRILTAVVALAVIGLGLAGLLRAVRPSPTQPTGQPTAPPIHSGQAQRLELTRDMMSTWVRIIAYGDDRDATSQTIQKAFDRMSSLEQTLSRFAAESDVARVNSARAGVGVGVSEGTWQVLEAAGLAWQRTGGTFDITVGPLVTLWRQAAERGQLPTEEELARARARVGFDKVQLLPKGRQVALTQSGMSIDLGGLAKGYIADAAVAVLREQGITSALVDAGGDIRVLGLRGDGQPWVTAVRNPETEDGRPFAVVLAVADMAVVTSGSYARYVEIDGRRYTHIIDPRTGWPETVVTSATVLGPDATSADALATALAVLGPAEGMPLIESLPEYECLIITGEGATQRLTRSSGFADHEARRSAP